MVRFVTGMLILAVCQSSALARKWTDSSGKYTVEAEYVDVKEGKVMLRKSDGTTIAIPLEKLCDADRQYLGSLKSPRLTGDNWKIDNPTLAILPGDYEDKTIAIGRYRSPFRISPQPDGQLVVFKCDLNAVTEDTQAVDTYCSRREVAFDRADETFRSLFGVKLDSERLKERTGKCRLFDMQRLVLIDPAGKSYKPLWCITPEAEFTFIFSGAGTRDIWEHSQVTSSELLPVAGRSAVRTNGVNTDASFVGLMEIGQAVPISALYEIPTSVKAEELKIEFDGGKPVAVRLKK